MLIMIIIISIAAPAVVAAAAEAPRVSTQAPPASTQLRRAVALLDYVATDYARAVSPQGEVLSPAEHQEQVGFVQDAARELRDDLGVQGEELAARCDALAREVAARASPERVAQEAR